MRRFLIAWAALTAIACFAVHARARIASAPMPAQPAQRWAIAALEAARAGAPLPPAPPEAERYRAGGEVIALAWTGGQVIGRYVGGPEFAASVRAAAAALAGNRELPARPAAPRASDSVRFTVSVTHGSGALLRGVPFLAELSVVPLREGLRAELGEARAFLTPDELLAHDMFGHVDTPIPDLAFGVDLGRAEKLLARQLGVKRNQLRESGRIVRFRADTITREPYPKEQRVDRASLERAAREGAKFLLRHQHETGRYLYVYQGSTGQEADARYNLPRHSGTTYFLAQAARVLDMPEARIGALLALRFLREHALRYCGAPDRLCISDRDDADMGSSALAALAAAELLRGGDDPDVRELLVGLTSFIRSMQRPDGELMHVYDLIHDEPVDVQRMYYSGEAAYALLASHQVLGDDRDLKTAQRLMGHLTGAGWNFFGSRYFYGEEHWTCQAVAQAAPRLSGLQKGIDFCARWLAFQRELLYRRGDTPWQVAGAIGVGPVIVPRLTTVASRTETGAMFYPVAKREGLAPDAVRAQVEANLGFLLRMSWLPGPEHLLADPAAAFGGVPASPDSLDVRNDFVQHAGSAMLLWAEVLAAEGG